jgi:muconolactone delta-isomerase
MEYLVTMTTRVPNGTPEEAVQDIRTREAAHSRVLAGQGHLVRLWRPPLQPGEWRTLGLFVAVDGDRLGEVLASMPLRMWRTDEVTPLSPHPNDPPPTPRAEHKAAEFLVTFTLAVPPGTPDQTVQDAKAHEAQAAHDLIGRGHLLRLWALPGAGRTLGLYQARDAAQMEAILASLPLAPWMTVDTTPLSWHPSDPATMDATCTHHRTRDAPSGHPDPMPTP